MSKRHAEQVEMVINRPSKIEVLGDEPPAEFNGEMVVVRPRKDDRNKPMRERKADSVMWSF
jgi:hypothetical protein